MELPKAESKLASLKEIPRLPLAEPEATTLAEILADAAAVLADAAAEVATDPHASDDTEALYTLAKVVDGLAADAALLAGTVYPSAAADEAELAGTE